MKMLNDFDKHGYLWSNKDDGNLKSKRYRNILELLKSVFSVNNVNCK
jgi:hypothetical protein